MMSNLTARFDELRAYVPSARGAKKQLAELRDRHASPLAEAAREALKTLPSSSSAGCDGTPSLLVDAGEAVQLLLWLGAFRSPTPEKLCHNVAARCLALGNPRMAAALSALVVDSLHADAFGGARSRSPPQVLADSQGPWLLPKLPAVVDPPRVSSCELALLSLCVHLPALQAAGGTAPGGGLGAALETMLGWLSLLRAASQRQSEEAGAENATASNGATPASLAVRAKAASAIHSAMAVLQRDAAYDALSLEKWAAQAQELCDGGKVPASRSASVSRPHESEERVEAAADAVGTGNPLASTARKASKGAGSSASAPSTASSASVTVDAELNALTAALHVLAPETAAASGASAAVVGAARPPPQLARCGTSGVVTAGTPARAGGESRVMIQTPTADTATTPAARRAAKAARAPGGTACEEATKQLRVAAAASVAPRSLAECRALCRPLKGLYTFFAESVDPLPPIRRSRDLDPADGGGTTPPLTLLDALATALDRCAARLGSPIAPPAALGVAVLSHAVRHLHPRSGTRRSWPPLPIWAGRRSATGVRHRWWPARSSLRASCASFATGRPMTMTWSVHTSRRTAHRPA